MKIFNIREKEIIVNIFYGNIREKICQNLETSFFTSKKIRKVFKNFLKKEKKREKHFYKNVLYDKF